ncbi:hypothetical protein H2200_006428 [Cladophialophora chaetospira]|uniref:Uncharacterized protein n=1 Tax=Cladophialophora chaetospira TaxID=386627 RepID=A0AA38X8R1_9EURO|nr:hypothetical protein H2200_006428 [Cladophialophora chaetospira]
MLSKETKRKGKALKKKSTQPSQITVNEASLFSGSGETAESVLPAAAIAVADDRSSSPPIIPSSKAFNLQREAYQLQTASKMNINDFSDNMAWPALESPIVRPASAPTRSKPLPDNGRPRPKDGKCAGFSSKTTVRPAVPVLLSTTRQGQGARKTNEALSYPASLGQKSQEGSTKKKEIPKFDKPETKAAYEKSTGDPSATSQATLRPMNETTPGPASAGTKRQKKRSKAQKDTQHEIEESQEHQVVEDVCNDDGETPKMSLDGPELCDPVDHENSTDDHALAEFKFDGLHPRLRCPKPDCRVMTSCWDSNVVICPACGPHSFTRYCKKEHLYDDMQRHWAVECGQNMISGPIDRDTIRSSQLPQRPYLAPQMPNMLERHRQAVYRAMEDADYFIFADIEEVDPDLPKPTRAQWNAVRGTGKLAFELRFFREGGLYSETQYFTYHIQQVLSIGNAGGAEDSCMRAFSMIRNGLIRDGAWRDEILSYLCMQVAGEWGGFKVPEFFYNVAEVNAIFARSKVLPAFA